MALPLICEAIPASRLERLRTGASERSGVDERRTERGQKSLGTPVASLWIVPGTTIDVKVLILSQKKAYNFAVETTH